VNKMVGSDKISSLVIYAEVPTGWIGGTIPAGKAEKPWASLDRGFGDSEECGHGRERMYDITAHYPNGGAAHKSLALCPRCAKQIDSTTSWKGTKRLRGYQLLYSFLRFWLEGKLGVRRSQARVLVSGGVAAAAAAVLVAVASAAEALGGGATLAAIAATFIAELAMVQWVLPSMILWGGRNG